MTAVGRKVVAQIMLRAMRVGAWLHYFLAAIPILTFLSNLLAGLGISFARFPCLDAYLPDYI
mgnify:CR=1 FL=1